MGFSITYAFIVMVLFIGLFAFMYETMPSEFFENQVDYEASYQTGAEVREYFEAADLEIYDSFGQDNMTYPYSSLNDHPAAPQFELPDGSYLEIWWSEGDYFVPMIRANIASKQWWGGWASGERLNWKTVDGQIIDHGSLNFISDANGVYLGSPYAYTDLTDNWNGNASVFYAFNNRVSISIAFMPTNSSKTIKEAWDAGEISYLLSYEINFEAMKPNAWTLLSQLLIFQKPDFGIPGLFGDLITYALSLGFWITIAIIIYTVITKLIPTIQGGLEN